MIISSPSQMIELGRSMSAYPKILLYGELGAGKTHFVKWYIGTEVHSPTYTYFHEHDTILHCDLYRVQSSDILISRWILEKINDYNSVIIEWPRFEELYADSSRCRVTITILDELTREITMS